MQLNDPKLYNVKVAGAVPLHRRNVISLLGNWARRFTKHMTHGQYDTRRPDLWLPS